MMKRYKFVINIGYVVEPLRIKKFRVKLWDSNVGCKYGKVNQKSVPVYYNHNCFSQRPKSSSNVLFKLDFFS